VLIVRGCQGQAKFFSLSFARWKSGALDLLLVSVIERLGFNYFQYMDVGC
jgi:hypothetical protein